MKPKSTKAVKEAIKNIEAKEPKKYHVILLNDDYTTMEFVVSILIKYFSKKVDEAYEIMNYVHTKGKGVAGTYSHEIAETKCRQAQDAARQQNFPLRCLVEKEI